MQCENDSSLYTDRSNKTGAVGCRIALRSPPCSLRGFATLSIPRWYAGEGASISIKALEPTPNSLRSYVAAAIGRGSPRALGLMAGVGGHMGKVSS